MDVIALTTTQQRERVELAAQLLSFATGARVISNCPAGQARRCDPTLSRVGGRMRLRAPVCGSSRQPPADLALEQAKYGHVDAVIGLVGVVVGGLLSGGVAWVMAARAERRRARASARLLEDELRRVDLVLMGLLAGASRSDAREESHEQQPLTGFIAESQLRDLSLERWFEHQGVLAEVLSGDSWYRVSRAYSVFPDLKAIGEMMTHASRDEEPNVEEILREIEERIAAGVRVLSRLAGTEVAARLAEASSR